MINLQTVSLHDLIPPNLRSDPNIFAAAKAIDTELQSMMESVKKLTYFDRFDSLSEDEVDELAWQFHVDFYDPTLPIEQRRELVKNSYRWHKRKGTPSAVEELIATVFGSGQIVEWYEYGGEPYHFRVTTSDPAASAERAQEFLTAIASVKNARSWLESIEITTLGTMDLVFGNALHMGEFMTIEQVV